METDQLPLEVVLARKSLRGSVVTFLSTLAMVALAFPGALNGGSWAGMVVLSGISLMIEAYSLKSNATLLEHFDVPKPVWLDSVRSFAFVGGPILFATGVWLAFRR